MRATIEKPTVAMATRPDPVPDAQMLSERARRVALAGLWVLAVAVGLGLVVYGFGPVFQARQQAKLARAVKSNISRAANESTGLGGTTTPSTAPLPGTPVAILEMGAIRAQQVVVEGGGSTQTQKGPGHVAGTAGPGQPGNSVVIGRAHGFGGPFGAIGALRKGDRILVTTTEGQSVYSIESVRHQRVAKSGTVYAPSKDDRLTLVTSASVMPWNRSQAIVVVATMQGLPFAPSPQNGRVEVGIGTDGDKGAAAAVVLAMVLFGATMSASIVLYRRVRPATAYLLTIGPVMASTVIAGETLSRLFPGWT